MILMLLPFLSSIPSSFTDSTIFFLISFPTTATTAIVDNNQDMFSSKDPFANMNEPTKEVKAETKDIVNNTATTSTTTASTISTNDSNATIHSGGDDVNNPHTPIKPSSLQSTTTVGSSTTNTMENSTLFASPVATTTTAATATTTTAAASTATTTGQNRLPTTSPSAGYTRTFPSPAGLPFDALDNSNHHHNIQANTTRVTQMFTESTNESASSSASNSTKSAHTTHHDQKAVTITKRRISAMTLKPPPLTNVPMTEDTMDDGLDLAPPPPPPASSSPEERKESQARGHVLSTSKDWDVPPAVPVTTSPVAAVISSAIVDPVVVVNTVVDTSEAVTTSLPYTSTSTMLTAPIAITDSVGIIATTKAVGIIATTKAVSSSHTTIPITATTDAPSTPIIHTATVTNNSPTKSHSVPATSSLSGTSCLVFYHE